MRLKRYDRGESLGEDDTRTVTDLLRSKSSLPMSLF